MPDHCHLLLTFANAELLVPTVANWKRYSARTAGIRWQRDFFEHRLRREESVADKLEYVLQNPVRAELVEQAERRPWVWLPDAAARKGALSQRAVAGRSLCEETARRFETNRPTGEDVDSLASTVAQLAGTGVACRAKR